MADNKLFVSIKPTRLTAGVTSTGTSITVAAIEDIYGNTVTMTDIGDECWGIFEPKSPSKREFFRVTGISSTTLTVERGIDAQSPYTATAANKKAHAAGTQVVIYTNSPAFYDSLVSKDNDETVAGQWTFTNPKIPAMDSYSAPTDSTQFATKGYVDAAATGTTNVDKLIVAGIAGETVAAGECVYMDTTDNEWKLTDASVTGTSENLLLGIAQGAGTNGNLISGGVLLFGRDDNQSGFAQGDLVYLSDTAGALAASAGTLSVCVGAALDADSIYFSPTNFLTALKQVDKTKIQAITASASEINQLTGSIISAAQLTEAGTFFGATDLSGAEAETLSNGSNADSLHYHSLLGAQHLPINLTAATNTWFQVATSPNGNYIYLLVDVGAGAPNINKNIYRFTKDTITGAYYYDGVSASLDQATYDWDSTSDGGICVGDTYVWVAGKGGTANDTRIVRLTAALASPQLMTISGTAWDVDIAMMAGDDTQLWLKDGAANTTVATYTISGTTATRGTNITIGDNGNVVVGFWYDGTNLFYGTDSATIKKYSTAGVSQSSGTRFASLTNQTINAPTGALWGIGYHSATTMKLFIISEVEGAGTDGHALDWVAVTKV